MTNEERELINKVFESETIYIYFEKNDCILEITPAITLYKKVICIFHSYENFPLVESFGVYWAFDRRTLEKSLSKREILKRKMEIKKLQEQIKELEEQL